MNRQEEREVLLSEFRETLLEKPAALDPAVRQAIATGKGVPAHLAGLVEKTRSHAYKITDEDLKAALAAGATQDQLFETAICAAFGAASERFSAATAALEAYKAAAENSTPAKAGSR